MANEYGLNVGQFRKHVLTPALEYIGLYSAAACNLLLGTAMQESRLSYVVQVEGPAIGLFQMEPATFRDIWTNYLAYKSELRERVNSLSIGPPTPEQMAGNIFFAVAMARVHYKRCPHPLPDAQDPYGMALYWKENYNTDAGKGTVSQALPHFREACKWAV